MSSQHNSTKYDWIFKLIVVNSSHSFNIVAFILDFLCIFSFGQLDSAISEHNLRKEYLKLIYDYGIYTMKKTDLSYYKLECFQWWSCLRNLYVSRFMFSRNISRLYLPSTIILHDFISRNIGVFNDISLIGFSYYELSQFEDYTFPPSLIPAQKLKLLNFSDISLPRFKNVFTRATSIQVLYFKEGPIQRSDYNFISNIQLVSLISMNYWSNLLRIYLTPLHCTAAVITSLGIHCPLLTKLSFMNIVNTDMNIYGTAANKVPVSAIIAIYRTTLFVNGLKYIETVKWDMNTKDMFRVLDDIFDHHPTLINVRIAQFVYRIKTNYRFERLCDYDDTTPDIQPYYTY